jgi:hypothetical protein
MFLRFIIFIKKRLGGPGPDCPDVTGGLRSILSQKKK